MIRRSVSKTGDFSLLNILVLIGSPSEYLPRRTNTNAYQNGEYHAHGRGVAELTERKTHGDHPDRRRFRYVPGPSPGHGPHNVIGLERPQKHHGKGQSQGRFEKGHNNKPEFVEIIGSFQLTGLKKRRGDPDKGGIKEDHNGTRGLPSLHTGQRPFYYLRIGKPSLFKEIQMQQFQQGINQAPIRGKHKGKEEAYHRHGHHAGTEIHETAEGGFSTGKAVYRKGQKNSQYHSDQGGYKADKKGIQYGTVGPAIGKDPEIIFELRKHRGRTGVPFRERERDIPRQRDNDSKKDHKDTGEHK
jgi:hypothetical protein